MRDVAERTAMHERGCAFQRLHQVGLEGITQQRRHRAVRTEVLRRDRLAPAILADDDPTQPLLEFRQRLREAQDRHHLRGHRDLKPRLAREAVSLAAQGGDDLTQGPVVHVKAATVGDGPHVQPQRVPRVDVVVRQGRQQVVGRGQRVHVAGEVQVDVLHRDHLRVSRRPSPRPSCRRPAPAKAPARRQWPSRRACTAPAASPMVTVVLPSPAGVGVIAVITTSLPRLPFPRMRSSAP